MAAGMIQEMSQDGGLQTYNPFKGTSLIHSLFGSAAGYGAGNYQN